jgi:hypothetical protein
MALGLKMRNSSKRPLLSKIPAESSAETNASCASPDRQQGTG